MEEKVFDKDGNEITYAMLVDLSKSTGFSIEIIKKWFSTGLIRRIFPKLVTNV